MFPLTAWVFNCSLPELVTSLPSHHGPTRNPAQVVVQFSVTIATDVVKTHPGQHGLRNWALIKGSMATANATKKDKVRNDPDAMTLEPRDWFVD